MNRKSILTFVAALSVAFGCTPADDAAIPEGSVTPKEQGFAGSEPDPGLFVVGISHLNVVVEDIEYATEFYARTLGFEQAHHDDPQASPQVVIDSPEVVSRDVLSIVGEVDTLADLF